MSPFARLVAGLTAVVLLGGAVAALTSSEPSTSAESVIVASPVSPTTASSTTTSTTVPSTTSSTATTAPPETSPAPTTTAPSAFTNANPATHESVTAQMPTDLAGEPTTTTIDDLTLQLTPWKTGMPGRIRIEIRLHASTGEMAGIHLDYGDGTIDPSKLDGCFNAGPGFVAPTPYDQVVSFDHTYRAAGDYVVSVTALLASTCPPPSTPRVIADQVPFHVDDGPGATNGPSQPEVYARIDRVDAGPDNHGYAVAAVFSAWDDDGWTSTVLVDWGDGTAATAHNPATCPTSIVGYPNGQFNASGFGIPTHDYGSPGTHTITLTVFSSGCGGTDPQTSNTSITTTVA